ncbi:MAG: ABC transporter substrate-binding protein [Candidatus Eisenbacteria bacterium]|nr:ABC transporter substrate-binding protein [Candidatus Eisenbacteria bacterium]
MIVDRIRIDPRPAALAAAALLILSGAAGGTEIAALFSGDTEPYVLAYEGFAEVCPANYWKVDLSRVDGEEDGVMRDLVEREPDLILALGTNAYRAAVGATDRIPIVFVLVLDYGEALPGNVAGASIRIDPALQMRTVRRLFPELKRLGVVYDPGNTEHVLEKARAEAEAIGLRIVPFPVKDLSETLRAYREGENDVDGWWLLPDRTTLASEAVDYVLKRSLERRVPVIAPSKKYVERGAQAALLPDYRAIGALGAEIALRILAGGKPSSIGIRYSKVFRLAVNTRTAREVAIDLSGSWAQHALFVGD